MSCLNHAYVVRTIADGKKNSLLTLLDELDDQRFLQRRNTAFRMDSVRGLN